MIPEIPLIPENEIEITFARSSGPGGQNVNKTNTKALAVWNIKDSNVFTEEQKEIIIATYHTEVLQAYNQETRSQPENRLRAIKKLNGLVQTALREEKDRVPTKPTFASRLKRLIKKQYRSRIKNLRQKPKGEE
jgi:ribosome-associated protein